MATRYTQTDFWSDPKIRMKATPEDKYFMLYLLTNQHTNQLGCYELTIEDAAFDLGYKESEVRKLFERMQERLDFAKYNDVTHEVLIKNWYKYNWTKSPKVRDYILKELKKVKCEEFREYFDRVCIPYVYPMIGYQYNYNNKNKYNYNNIYNILQEEFGRTITSVEYEIVQEWISKEYNPEIIKLAIKEAVLNQARSFKYIDKILFDWAKQGLKREKDIAVYLDKRNNKSKPEEKSLYQDL
ncbi:MAG: DnaD domain protein [Bacilli bacterium]|nr:DnaD domain protein [Bacilli bacterium]